MREFAFSGADIWFLKFAIDPSLQILAVGNAIGQLWLWNVDGRPLMSPIARCVTHPKCTTVIRHMSFSPDSRYLVCCCEDGTVWKWRLGRN